MGLMDLFRKDEVTGTRVLVSSIDARFAGLVEADGQVYKRSYPATKMEVLAGIAGLNQALGQKYDVVHLLCDVSAEGVITDSSGKTMSGPDLIQKCCDADVKLLWVGSENKSDAYIKGFNARGKKINLVMTLARKGPYFTLFLKSLLEKTAAGEAIPKAWNDLTQSTNSVQPDAPDCIFSAGRAAVRLR